MLQRQELVAVDQPAETQRKVEHPVEIATIRATSSAEMQFPFAWGNVSVCLPLAR